MPRIMRKAILDSDVNEDEGHDAQDNEERHKETNIKEYLKLDIT